ncbi:MAG: hypothetical protein KDA77_03695, partial [Planctomycetaceae bacterium]|nr:hypothetical protein [Planctomycetaceae bacterium]
AAATPTNDSKSISSAEAAFASTAISPAIVQPRQTVTVIKQEQTTNSVLQPEWDYAPYQLVQNSIFSIGQSTDLDQLAGSLIDVTYETEQYLTDEFGKIKSEDNSYRFDFAHDFEFEDAVETVVVDEELDSLFTEWAGPLV